MHHTTNVNIKFNDRFKAPILNAMSTLHLYRNPFEDGPGQYMDDKNRIWHIQRVYDDHVDAINYNEFHPITGLFKVNLLT